MTPPTSHSRNSARFRFRLRELMLLVVVIGLLLAIFNSGPHRQRRAVDRVLGLGGRVSRVIGEGEGVAAHHRPSAWRRRVLGEQLTRVRSIDLSGSRVSDADLKCLTPLTDSRALLLSGTRVDGSGLTCLRWMPLLQTLDLSGTNVTDSSLVHLRDLTNLEELVLDHTSIDGTGLSELARPESLKKLSLRGTAVTDATLVNVARFRRLATLHLDDTRVTGAGLVHLRDCVELRALSVEGTGVSIAGLRHLRSLNRLSEVQALGLDLNAIDLGDEERIRRKLTFLGRRRVVADPSSLGTVVAAWRRRQNGTVSWRIEAAGTRRRGQETTDLEMALRVDARRRVRLTTAGFGWTERPRVTDLLVDGAVETQWTRGDDGVTEALSNPATKDWMLRESSLPIVIALRPLAPDGLLNENLLAMTSDRETVNGRECLVMYHGDGKVWVDAARDHVPLRFSFINGRGVTFGQFDVTYQEDDDVGWVPAGWKHVVLGPDGCEVWRSAVTVRDYSLNETIPDGEFLLESP